MPIDEEAPLTDGPAASAAALEYFETGRWEALIKELKESSKTSREGPTLRELEKRCLVLGYLARVCKCPEDIPNWL
jgi:hypothetical protein